ncbi:copper resistance protein CopC [Ameyamaea chiangmaiensis]|nr:copper resistance protein CopC [Ameyamaea chiangmaiensis]
MVHGTTLVVTLRFDRDLDPVRGRMMLLEASGPPQLVMVPPPQDPRVLTASIPVVPGAYTVLWQASDKDDKAADGTLHVVVQP